MYRLLWESELFVFVPDHPEIHGEFPLENGDEFVFCIYPHKEGPFMAVFTSEAAADWAGEQIPPPAPALAGIRGEALFRMAEKAGMWVRVNHGMRAGIIQEPKGVAAMVRGDWTELRRGGPGDGPTLVEASAEELPAELLDAVQGFCEDRNGALAVYGFFSVEDTSVEIHFNNLILVVCLREGADAFYSDFVAMVGQRATDGLAVSCDKLTPDQAKIVRYLRKHTPLWPVA